MVIKMNKFSNPIFKKILKYIIIVWISITIGAQLGIKETRDRYFKNLAELPNKKCYDWRDMETIFNL